MRDRRFVAVHRGGPLSLEHHRLLMRWAHDCALHVLPLLAETEPDGRLRHALETALAWERGEIPTGAAMKASVAAHAAARAASSPVATFVARAAGQAVATAHMADHSLGAAWYGLKAVKAAGQSVAAERIWQDRHTPPEMLELVLSARADKRI